MFWTLLLTALFGGTPILVATPTVRQETPITLTFVGDLMFDRYVRERATINGYEAILRDVVPVLASSTLVFGNLEGPITTFKSVSDYRDSGPNHFRFTFATTVAAVLRSAGFTAVSLANNHIGNFGQDGIAQTVRWLDAEGVGYTGVPEKQDVPWRTIVNEQAISLFGYDPWNTPQPEALLTRIHKEATSTFVIVFAHWGSEYGDQPDDSVRTLAHRFVDVGVDLVIGSHPHVIQGKEFYHGTWIYYSLGNAVFDQYFEPRVRCGAVAHVTIHPSGLVATRESFLELRDDGTTGTNTCGSEDNRQTTGQKDNRL